MKPPLHLSPHRIKVKRTEGSWEVSDTPRFGSYAPIDRKVTRPAWFIREGDVVRYEVGVDPRWQVGIVMEVTEGVRPGTIWLWTGPISRLMLDRNSRVEWLGHVDPGTWSLNPVYDAVQLEFQR